MIDNSPEAIAKKIEERKAAEKEKEKKIGRLTLILVALIMISVSLFFGFITGSYWLGIIIAVIVFAISICCGFCFSLFPCFGTDIRAGFTNVEREWHTQEDKIRR